MNTISIAVSKMQVRFRVIGNGSVFLYSCEHYQSAEEFCWKYDGTMELEIRKIWIQKT